MLPGQCVNLIDWYEWLNILAPLGGIQNGISNFSHRNGGQ